MDHKLRILKIKIPDMKFILSTILFINSFVFAMAVEKTPDIAAKIEPLTAEWKAKIAKLAPVKPRVKPKVPRKVLVFSLTTGYCHKVIPYVKQVMTTLSDTGAFEVTHSDNINDFTPESLKAYDAVVLNNTCPKRPARSIFLDALESNKNLTAEQKQARADELEQSLIQFVAGGKGVVAVHGGITFLNESKGFGEMIGGSFVRHPKLQRITLNAVDPKHPLVKAFQGEAFIHTDEPYLFNKAYDHQDFRPLLEMDVSQLDIKAKKTMQGGRRYVSWIKKHGKGRVFYVSPSHQPESYESRRMLQYYLDGIQYALGDLECDDQPVSKKKD